MENIPFNLRDPRDHSQIDSAMAELRVTNISRHHAVTTKHLAPLNELARSLGAEGHTLQNARRLATGFKDLVVILQEPSDLAEDRVYEEMVSASPTLKHVDTALSLASNGGRSLSNTVTVDLRLFRSARIRGKQEDAQRLRDDKKAYAAVEEILELLRPVIVIVCQCETAADVTYGVAADLCSSVRSSGDISPYVLPNGHRSIKVNSFHPMYFARMKKKEELFRRVLAHNLFNATFSVAINALAGRKIHGSAFFYLRLDVLKEKYLMHSSEDEASPELMEDLGKLNLTEVLGLTAWLPGGMSNATIVHRSCKS